MTYRKAVAAFLALSIATQGSFAATYTTKESLNLYAMGVTGTLATEAIRSRGFLPNGSSFSFNGGFSESGFWSSTTGQVDGASFQLDYTGSLAGNVGEAITIDIGLIGQLGTHDITGQSTMTWDYDATAGGYKKAVLAEHGEINPIWFWVAAVLLAAITTANAPGPADIQYDPAPNDPDSPTQQGSLDIDEDGGMTGSLDGVPTFDGGLNGTDASGNVSTIPEPDAGLLAILGAFLAAVFGWRKRHALRLAEAGC